MFDVFSATFWLGDLNYRLQFPDGGPYADVNMVKKKITEMAYAELQELDQVWNISVCLLLVYHAKYAKNFCFSLFKCSATGRHLLTLKRDLYSLPPPINTILALTTGILGNASNNTGGCTRLYFM